MVKKAKRAVVRGKEALIEKYGALFPGESEKERKARFGAIDWLEANFTQAAIVFGGETVQRRLCALKGIDFDSYDDPND
jgi:hypothetical protein